MAQPQKRKGVAINNEDTTETVEVTASGVLLSFSASCWKGYVAFGLVFVSSGFRRSVSDGSSPKQSL
jgi:hypothetical protein